MTMTMVVTFPDLAAMMLPRIRGVPILFVMTLVTIFNRGYRVVFNIILLNLFLQFRDRLCDQYLGQKDHTCRDDHPNYQEDKAEGRVEQSDVRLNQHVSVLPNEIRLVIGWLSHCNK